MRQVELIPGVVYSTLRWSVTIARLGGATVAHLTPVQKVACSNHVRVTSKVFPSGIHRKCETHQKLTIIDCFCRHFLLSEISMREPSVI